MKTEQAGQLVVFSIKKQLYSLAIEEVVEILRCQTVTVVPGIISHIEGVINLRGKIIPVINLIKRFSLENEGQDKKSRIVIVQGDTENIGLMVDEVNMVTTVEEEHVEQPPSLFITEDCLNGYAKYDGKIIGILNLSNVLYPKVKE